MSLRAPLPDSADTLTDFGHFALTSIRGLEAENKELRKALAEAHRDLATLTVQIDDAEKELDLMAAR